MQIEVYFIPLRIEALNVKMLINKRVFYIRNQDPFPPVEESLNDGLLAIGGDLSEERLINAYSNGIFPWYDERSPIMWYSPLERCLFKPDSFKVSHSLRQKLRNRQFTFTFDHSFKEVIKLCASTNRNGDSGTWITPEMMAAYTSLHQSGYAHSLEVWHNGQLAGGLYGVSLGKAFFGESMFHSVTDASKAALYYLCNQLFNDGYHFIDAQMETSHLLSLGAVVVQRSAYLTMLNDALKHPTRQGVWLNNNNENDE